MNRKLSIFKIENNEFEEISRPARSSKELSRRVIVKPHPGDDMFEIVDNVGVRDLMTPSRWVDPHSLSVVRKYCESTGPAPEHREGVTLRHFGRPVCLKAG